MTEGEPISPDDSFAILGNETRMAILRELWEARDPLAPPADNALSFSELRERVGVADSGQFNYHLDQLVGAFVQQSDTGYRLGPAATGVMKAVVTGSLSGGEEERRLPASDPCPFCGADVELVYSSPTLVARCTSCPGEYRSPVHPEGTLMSSSFFPPSGVEGRDGQELWEALADNNFSRMLGCLRGVCSSCGARPNLAVDACENHDEAGLCEACGSTQAVLATTHCDHCSSVCKFPAAVAAALHPAVIGFFHERGIDGHGGLTLEAYNRLLGAREVVHSANPLELEVIVEAAGVERSFTIDESLAVVGVRT